MDNITHSLVGAYIGVATADRLNIKNKARAVLVSTSIVANNLPDLDLLYVRITPGPLGYLLHHRGHTHTILFALVPFLIMIAILGIIRLRTGKQPAANFSKALLFVMTLGSLVHLALDGLNSYGIHPFWPLDNRWFYGDTLFIVEPILWLIFSAGLYFHSRKLLTRIVLIAIFLIASGLLLFSGHVPILIGAGLVLAASLFVSFIARLKSRSANTYTALAASLTVFLFAISSLMVHLKLKALHAKAFPKENLADLISSPHPANPLCWNVIYVSSDNKDYFLRRGVYSLVGSVDSVCSRFSEVGDWANQIVEVPPNQHQKWSGMFRAPLTELRSLARDNCQVRAFLQFARAPIYKFVSAGVIFSDLRFDRGAKPGRRFSDLLVTSFAEQNQTCPKSLPSWIAPRTDVLN